MAYDQTLNALSLSPQEKLFLKREFDSLRAELDDLRTNYTALLAKLDDVAAIDPSLADFPVDFESTLDVADAQFTAK